MVIRFPSRIRFINNQLLPEPQYLLGAFLIFLWKVLLWSCKKENWTLCEVAVSWFLAESLWSVTCWHVCLESNICLFDVFYYSPWPIPLGLTMSKMYSKICMTELFKPSKAVGDAESLHPPRWINQTVEADFAASENAFRLNPSSGSSL